jgi:ATP-dependent Lon protease
MSEIYNIPLLPLRDVVVYPQMVIPLFVGREKSIAALEQAMEGDKVVLLVAQKNASEDDPGAADIFNIGTVSTIVQLLKLPDGTVKVLVEGGQRATVSHVVESDGFYSATAKTLEQQDLPEKEAELLVKTTMGQFDQYVNTSKKVPSEVMSSLNGIDEPGKLADTIAAHLSLDVAQKQEILELDDIHSRIEFIMGLMSSEIDLFNVEKRIRGRVKKQMEKKSTRVLS